MPAAIGPAASRSRSPFSASRCAISAWSRSPAGSPAGASAARASAAACCARPVADRIVDSAQRSRDSGMAGSGWASVCCTMRVAWSSWPAAVSASAAATERGSAAGSAGEVSSRARSASRAAVCGDEGSVLAAARSSPASVAGSLVCAASSRWAAADSAEPPRFSRISPNWRCSALRAGPGMRLAIARHIRSCRNDSRSSAATSSPASIASSTVGSSVAGVMPSISVASSSRNDRPSTAAVSSSC